MRGDAAGPLAGVGSAREDFIIGGRRDDVADSGHKTTAADDFDATLEQTGLELLRPARKGEKPRAGSRFFTPLRQIIESINDTLKGQLDLEQHGGRAPDGVITRITQRLLAMTAAIWHNDRTGQAIRRSLTAYDH